MGTFGALRGASWGHCCNRLGGEVGRRMGPGSTVPGTGFASGIGAQDLQACSRYGIHMHGVSRAPTRRLCPPGLLHVPTEVGDCVTFLSTANFNSTSYTMYTCCKQLFARWVWRSPEPYGPPWGTQVVGQQLVLTALLSFQLGARERDALLHGSLGRRGGERAVPDAVLQVLQPHVLHGDNLERCRQLPTPGTRA